MFLVCGNYWKRSPAFSIKPVRFMAMDFDVYCDESHPDLLCARNPSKRYMLIGSLWLQSADRDQFKLAVKRLRQEHEIGAESKWQKVSIARIEYYKALVDWFSAQDTAL